MFGKNGNRYIDMKMEMNVGMKVEKIEMGTMMKIEMALSSRNGIEPFMSSTPIPYIREGLKINLM